MKIKITDEYSLESDANCWAIGKWESSREKYIQICWYSSFESAIDGLARRMIRVSGAETLEDAIKDAVSVKNTLLSALEPQFKVEEV